MAFNFFSKIFKKEKTLTLNNYNPIEKYAQSRSLIYFHNRTLYHLSKKISSKTLLLDPHYGLYIIDSVDWMFDDVHHSKVSASRKKNSSNADVQVDELHAFITQKFNEVLHTEVCPIVNILYLSNITNDEFKQLDESFHSLLPSQFLIFKDSGLNEIEQHLHQDVASLNIPIDTNIIQSALFVDSCIHTHNTIKTATHEQKEFIFAPLEEISSVNAAHFSGKTTTLLLKVIKEKLHNPDINITIIVSTQYASDTLRQELLQLIEYAIVDIDLNSIRVLTTSSMGSKLTGSGYLFCDDAQLYSKAFIEKLMKMKKSYKICFLGHEIKEEKQNFTLTHTFEIPPSINYENYLRRENSSTMTFCRANVYLRTVLVLQRLLVDQNDESILIVLDDREVAKKLREEINDYYDNICSILDTTLSISQLKRNRIEIININELSMFTCKHLILALNDTKDKTLIEFALSRATKHIYVFENEGN